ncbi:MAG: hypothetical protein GX887_07825, partial [Firmicutes bacterium]|nr:hypothetical protein [Bacillota bacterium]
MSKRIGALLFAIMAFGLIIIPIAGCSLLNESSQTESEGDNGAVEAEKLELPGGPHQYPYPEGLVLPQVHIISRDYY